MRALTVCRGCRQMNEALEASARLDMYNGSGLLNELMCEALFTWREVIHVMNHFGRGETERFAILSPPSLRPPPRPPSSRHAGGLGVPSTSWRQLLHICAGGPG